MVYKFIYPNCDLAVLTDLQRVTLTRIADQYGMTSTVEVSPIYGVDDGAVFVDTGTLLIGVETDGYAHT